MSKTYLDIRTETLKPRHTDFGAVGFGVLAPKRMDVATDGQLFDALRAAQAGGVSVHLLDTITVGETVKLPGGVVLTGGAIRAGASFRGNHLLEMRGIENVMLDAIDLDADGQGLIALPIMDGCRSIILRGATVRNGKTGVTISGGSSNISIIGCESSGHHTWHGFAVQDTDCESIAILSCRAHGNAAYGIDSHGTNVEVAGCAVWSNGRNTEKYNGGCTKFPEAHNHWIHDNTLENDGSGYGLVWAYGDPSNGERLPDGIFVYRNRMLGGPHYRTGPGAVIRHADNDHQMMIDGEPQPTQAKTLGRGRIIFDPNLQSLPTEIDEPQPVPDPEPPHGLTEADVRRIAREEFRALVDTMKIEVRLE